jgi:pimeloyl-ACP methyl ester carboxylesterase
MLQDLSRDFELIRYDQRGNGLSDWDIEGYSLEAMTLDLKTVLDDHGADQYAVLGISQGCAVSVKYAVENPDRISRLILYGGYSRGSRKRGNKMDHAKEEALTTLIREGWGQDNPAFRQIFTSQLMPDANAEQMNWFNDLQREASSPENAAKLRITIDEMDITDLLPQVTQPTLVMHRKGDARQPFEEGRRMASLIPNAQFIALEGRNHAILDHEPEWAEFMGYVRDFLKT